MPLLAAARLALADGGAPLRVRAMLLSSDFVAKSLARGIAAACGAEIYQHWGMTETGYGGAVDCACHAGCHLRECELFVEAIDPGTGERMPSGRPGELVVSTLRKRGVPLLRYRTGDLACLIEEPCRCGSVLRRLTSFAGRLDAGLALPACGGVTLPLIDEELFAIDGVTDFTARIKMGALPSLQLLIGAPGSKRSPALLEAVHARLTASPVIGEALRSGAMRAEAAFADAIVFHHGAKRRLLIEENPACAPCC